MAVNFICGGNRSTDLSQVTDKLYCIHLTWVSSTPHLSGIRTHNISGMIGTDYKGSCKSNYHTTMTSTAPQFMEGTNTTTTKYLHYRKDQTANRKR